MYLTTDSPLLMRFHESDNDLRQWPSILVLWTPCAPHVAHYSLFCIYCMYVCIYFLHIIYNIEDGPT